MSDYWTNRFFDIVIDAVRRNPSFGGMSRFEAEVAFGDVRETFFYEIAELEKEIISSSLFFSNSGDDEEESSSS